MGEWKSGDVAMVTGRWWWHKPHTTERAIRDTECWTTGSRDVMDHEVSAVRPLVVIDPEDAEQVERLRVALVEKTARPIIDHELAAALREFARPTPSIEEPQGLGAVVEDAQGQRWVRLNPSGLCQWLMEDAGALGKLHDGHRGWDSLHAVRILAPGVES